MKLRSEAVSPKLMTLLRRLLTAEPLVDFYLVGGSALGLRYGHRFSVDLGLFTSHSFDCEKLSDFLMREFV